ncbi:MAG: undecaprenyl-diphosphate phosphatase [Clostridiales bacterium]|jgi:undecaprenyl-diphosphatase|nr:undecaprenyl-diphosphate phosphatase [Clostridiales bacterium]
MDVFKAIILGLVQGLAEFLPVSSSGHLILAREILNVPGNYLTFDIMLHVATLFAIFAVFYKELSALFKPPFKTIGLIALATVPAGIAGLIYAKLDLTVFDSAKYLCFFFIISAGLMLVADLLERRRAKSVGAEDDAKSVGAEDARDDAKTDAKGGAGTGGRQSTGVESITLKTAVCMGLMQGVAVFPGVTRSGSTIFGGIAAKGEKNSVAKFSFFMSAPVILAAAAFDIFDGGAGLPVDAWCYVAGMAAAFVSGFFAIKLMLRVVGKARLRWFALYLAVLSVVTFSLYFI